MCGTLGSTKKDIGEINVQVANAIYLSEYKSLADNEGE